MTLIKTIVTSSKGVVSTNTSSIGDSTFEVQGTLSASQYLGINVGSESATTTNIAAYNQTRTFHEPTISADRGTLSPGQGPTLTTSGSLMYLSFTPNDTGDRAFRMFKIPTNYIGSSSFHVHWTKSGVGNEFGKNVRWKIGYSVYNGLTEDSQTNFGTVELEDTYENSGTTESKIVHRTSNVAASNFIAGYYVSMYIEAISPTGSARASEPALVSADLTYLAYINQ